MNASDDAFVPKRSSRPTACTLRARPEQPQKNDDEVISHEAHAGAPRPRPEPLARQHHRDLLDDGTLKRYVDELSVTGLTSNPTIFAQAIKNSRAYDPAIARKMKEGRSAEELFFELALEDLGRAADVFRPVHDRTAGVDGFVSWRSRRSWPTTRRARSPRRRSSTRARAARTCSSRSRGRRRGSPPSRRPSSPGSP